MTKDKTYRISPYVLERTININIRVVIHDFWLVGLEVAGDLLHADFALQSSCHLHAMNCVALTDDCW
jgi:hypothetical protein